MPNVFLLLSFVVLFAPTCLAQKQNGKNTLTVGTGRTRNFLEETGIRAFGGDYLRQIGTSKWEWGLQLDFDFEKDLSQLDGISTAGIAAYSITPYWPFFGGGGIKTEEHGIAPFLRIGTEYAFFFTPTSAWFFSPGIFCDFAEDGFTPSLMWVVGVRF